MQPLEPAVFRDLWNSGLGSLLARLRVSKAERNRCAALYLARAAALLPPAAPFAQALDLHARMVELANAIPAVVDGASVQGCLASVLLINGRVPSVSSIRRALARTQ